MFREHYFLFHLTIVILVAQGTFVGGSKCACWCPKSKSQVCDAIDTLQIAEDVNRREREKWNKYFEFVVKMHRGSEEDVEQGEGSVNMPMSPLAAEKQNAELLAKVLVVEEKLLAAESRAVKLEADLEKEMNARIGFENQMAEFERKLQGALYQFEKSETHLKKETDARIMIEEEMLRNFSIVMSTAEERNLELHTSMSVASAKLYEAENLAKRLESELEEEKEARKLFEEDLLRNVTSVMLAMATKNQELWDTVSTLEGDLNYTSLRAAHIQFFLVKALEEIRDFKEVTFPEFSTKISMNENKTEELQVDVSNIEDRLQYVENQTWISERRSIEAGKEVKRELLEKMAQDFSSTISADENKCRELQIDISNIKVRLKFIENQVDSSESAIKEEKKARKELEGKIAQGFSSAISTYENKTKELQIGISNIKVKLKFIENQVDSSESAIKEEKKARKELEEDVEAIRKKCEATSEGSNQRQIRALEKPTIDFFEEFGVLLGENNTMPMETAVTEEPNTTENIMGLGNVSTEIPGTDEQISQILNDLSKLETRFRTTENRLKVFDIDLKMERNSREIFELDFVQNFTKFVSVMGDRDLQLLNTISEVQENLISTNRRTTILELGLRYIINKLDVLK